MDNGIFNSPFLACTQILIHIRVEGGGGGGPELGFYPCFADGLNPEFSSICGTGQYQGCWFSITLAGTKSELEATKRVNFHLVFKCVILQYTGFVRFFGLKIQGLSRPYFPFFKDSTHCKIKGCSASHGSDCVELKDR